MLNGDWVRNMSDAELAEFLRSFRDICAYPKYADIEGWLASDNKEMSYKGEAVTYQGKPAVKVGERVIWGTVYDEIIQDGILCKVPGV